MAKKKKRRPPAARPASTRPRSTQSTRSVSGTPSVTGTTPGVQKDRTAAVSEGATASATGKAGTSAKAVDAQNRLARKEAARRQREALRRKAARRRLLRRVVTVGGTVLVLGALIYLVSRPSGLDAQERSLLDSADDAAVQAGCTDTEEVPPYSPEAQDTAHVGVNIEQLPPLSTYPSQPPASGPHDQSPMPAEIYPTAPSIGRVIHSLEHGAVVIWHRPDAPEGQIDRLSRFFRAGDRLEKVIVAPYDYPDQGEAGVLPPGTNMALVAWHRLQTCQRINLAVAFEFVNELRGDRGEAPEPNAGI
jgi:hypothetical protein